MPTLLAGVTDIVYCEGDLKKHQGTKTQGQMRRFFLTDKCLLWCSVTKKAKEQSPILIPSLPFYFKMVCKQNLNLRCVWVPAPLVPAPLAQHLWCWGQNTS